ncbi:MAG: 4Fe-4S dicluster domain-containing protein, partial [Pseudomonadota bacterium]|nr:4Fe-4S dicluster domain-containing protein [Pseudomonadota bacterium]
MHTDISAELRQLPEVQLSESILRNCVHCGFCNATCPTYLLTGNELEGPRGRIYLMKSVLEERIEPSLATLSHIDNCLGCLACETTCPSGVRYSTLLEDARPRLEALGLRPWWQRLQRRLLTTILPHPGRLRLSLALSRIGRLLPALVPRTMHHQLSMAPRQLPTPASVALPGTHPAEGGQRIRVLLLTGCAQQVLGAAINDATVRLLTRLGAQVTIPEAEICCGSLTYHMGERRKSRRLMATTLRRWHRVIAEGTDYIVSTTSGCSTTIADYVHIFA